MINLIFIITLCSYYWGLEATDTEAKQAAKLQKQLEEQNRLLKIIAGEKEPAPVPPPPPKPKRSLWQGFRQWAIDLDPPTTNR